MRQPTDKNFWFTIKKYDKINGLYFYHMKDLKGTKFFNLTICIRLFGKNIL